MSTADSFRKPMRKFIDINLKSFGENSDLLKYHNRDASSKINSSIKNKEGNRFTFELPSNNITVGHGPVAHYSQMGKQYAEATFDGQHNVAMDFTLRDTTFDMNIESFMNTFSDSAGQSFGNKSTQNFANELTRGQWAVPFDISNPGKSMQKMLSKMKRNGMGNMGKPNMLPSVNILDHIDYFKNNAMNEKGITAYSSQFNMVDAYTSDYAGFYETGDRDGICFTVRGGCQTGCKLLIDGGIDAANRVVAYQGEYLEIEGVDGVITKTKMKTKERMQFIVQMDIITDENGIAEVPIYPYLRPLNVPVVIDHNYVGQPITTDAEANVTASPADGAFVRFSPGLKPNSEYEQAVVWFNDSMVLVSPETGNMKGFAHYEKRKIKTKTGSYLTSMTYTVDGNNKIGPTETHRLDMFMDSFMLLPEYAGRLIGPIVGGY